MPNPPPSGARQEDPAPSFHEDSWYRTLIESSQDLVSILGADGRIVYDNPSVERVLGYRQGELTGLNAFDRVHPDDLTKALEMLARTIGNPGASAAITLRFRHKDRSWRVLESIGTCVPGNGGTPQVVINSRDVTESVQTTTELTLRVRERTREVEEAHIEMLERLARAAEFRDDDTGEHTRRVGTLAARLATALGLPAEQVDLIRRTAPLHDIGKIGIADSILRKPGPLTAEEFGIMRGHTLLGARILAGGKSPFLKTAESVALRHHERWDGTGYPDGLRGDEIPMIARIVAIVDVFDALTHDRPYRDAWPGARVLAEIGAESGKHFDPSIANCFLTLDDTDLETV